MWKFFFDFFSYVCFVCVLYVISYSNRGQNESYQVRQLQQLLLNPQNRTYNFSQIVKINKYWKWLEESFLMNIVPENWYNGQPDNNSQGYLNDKVNRIIGWATIRQLRIKPDTCRIKSIIEPLVPTCYGEYSGSNEESGSFFPGWTTNGTIQNYSSSIKQAFIYQTGEQLGAYTYVGNFATYGSGGYVYEFRDSLSQMRNDLSQLHQLGWIDRQTRAVLIQMNLYNPNIPLYTSVVLIIEILPSSGIYPSSQFQPFIFNTFTSVFQIVCAFIYLTFIVYFMIIEGYSLIRLKTSHFSLFFSYPELGVIVCSWTNVGIYIWRTNEATRITNLFHETHGNVYINFQLIAYIDSIFTILLGFCCFFGTLKFLRLYHYDRRLALLSNTLQRASREIMSFSFMFLIIFMAFLTLFYLQFNTVMWEFSDLLHTAEMLFEMLLLKFNASVVENAGTFLGPCYFTLYVLCVVFVCMNMFISIIIDNFRIVRAEVHKVDDDNQDVFINFLKKLHRWFGDDNSTNTITKQRVITVAEMKPPMQRLAIKLDQLMIYVNRRYGNDEIQIARDEATVLTLTN